MLACGGCHGSRPAADPASYPTAEQDQVTAEVAAAQHMKQNGGSTDPAVAPTPFCLVCHGAGMTADLYDAHKPIQYRSLPADPNN